jgi:hypothetical protein
VTIPLRPGARPTPRYRRLPQFCRLHEASQAGTFHRNILGNTASPADLRRVSAFTIGHLSGKGTITQDVHRGVPMVAPPMHEPRTVRRGNSYGWALIAEASAVLMPLTSWLPLLL